jgi:hypothetical protein
MNYVTYSATRTAIDGPGAGMGSFRHSIRLQKGDGVSRENYVNTVESWRQLLDPMDEQEATAVDIRQQRAELEAMHKRAKELVQKRAELQASMQTATRELQAILKNGRINASYLRKALRYRHGRDSEQLVRFGLRPDRRRSWRKREPESKD